MFMKIAIVDDLRQDIVILENYLLQYKKEMKIEIEIESYISPSGFMNQFIQKNYDLIFLDIYLNDKEKQMNGMDLAKEIRKTNEICKIVFFTSSKDFAIDGYMVNAFGYLVKPYSYENLKQVFVKYNKLIKKREECIQVKEKGIMVKIRNSDIIYTSYYNHYIYIHTKNNVVRTYLKFSNIQELLKMYPQFINCNRNVIVNMDEVKELDGNDFLMSNGERISIRRGEKKYMWQIYADYIFEKMEKKNEKEND